MINRKLVCLAMWRHYKILADQEYYKIKKGGLSEVEIEIALSNLDFLNPLIYKYRKEYEKLSMN